MNLSNFVAADLEYGQHIGSEDDEQQIDDHVGSSELDRTRPFSAGRQEFVQAMHKVKDAAGRSGDEMRSIFEEPKLSQVEIDAFGFQVKHAGAIVLNVPALSLIGDDGTVGNHVVLFKPGAIENQHLICSHHCEEQVRVGVMVPFAGYEPVQLIDGRRRRLTVIQLARS